MGTYTETAVALQTKDVGGEGMNYKDRVISLLRKWEMLGVSRSDRVTYYGERSLGMPPGWMHALFDPLRYENLNIYFSNNPHLHARGHSKFLQDFNGVRLFRGLLDIFGLHLATPERPAFKTAQIPGNLGLENHNFRPLVEKWGGVMVGCSMFSDIELGFIELRDGSVISAELKDGCMRESWGNFHLFLFSEIDRLNELFSVDGKFLNKAGR